MSVVTEGVAVLMFLAMILSLERVVSEPAQDKQALLAFLSKVPHEQRLQWNESASACSWVGVECDASNSSVYSLRLPGVGLVGQIPADTLGRLTQLRVLSLRSNRLSGPIPPDFLQIKLLRNVYLQDNQFSGEFPASLTELTRLTRLDISSNNFTGPIPFSVSNLTHLTGLFLQNNGFSGKIPSIAPPGLVNFNISNNRLNGSIPPRLQSSRHPHLQITSICAAGLCRLKEQKALYWRHCRNISRRRITSAPPTPRRPFPSHQEKEKQGSKKSPKPPVIPASRAVGEAGTSSSKDDVTGGSAEGAERNKLIFFHGGGYSFDLEDLLRASAEVLGKGSVGTSYKAVLEEGTTVVVKRLKDVAVTKKEFEQQMEVLGNIKHQNVLPLRAFYFSKDEKLLVYDYMPAGSLSALLHGSRGSGRTPLEWDNRLKIALSTARGLAHLHVSGNVVHGNIKSSNILLKQDNLNACVSDYGLNPLFLNSTTPPNHRIMGYRAPEVLETRKVTFKSDVYSFGVLLLELLTGKAPNQASLGEEGIDLPRWVQSVVREEWTAEVFDVELMRYHNVEEEMVQLLQIGMACVATVPDQRPTMQDVLRMIEDMNRGDTDDGLRQSSDDALRGSDSQTPPTESRASPPSFTP
ncbi:putative inactive receptor kinase [Sesamum alatum]|uniref:Inactive receptor kinase n=1 Tax=Sesamum alatum TaxID=300844 RepID=A0AAE2CFJ2_9LAMI|nr:putative inactive receptor kinase [Sesamum alatum]